jgi:hypothetical protein
MVGAVVAAPGTLPTNWAENLSGLTRSIIATGSELGVDYVDIRLNGTSSGTSADIRFESTTQIVAANGQVWTESAFVKLISAPNPPTQYTLSMQERTAAGSFVTGGVSAITPTATLARHSFTRTLSGGVTVERVQPAIGFTLVNGATYDFTIRIGWPQMETGSVATSPIVTTAGTASRVADGVTLASASSLIGQTQGTLYLEFERTGFTQSLSQRLFNISDGSTTNRILMFISVTDGFLSSSVTTGGVAQALIADTVLATGLIRVAIAYNTNDVIYYKNGTSLGNDTLATIPACNRVNIGIPESGSGSSENFIGWIRSVALFPTRLANATLASLTTP